MTKMRVGVRAHSRWRIALVIGALSVACLIPLASPGAASASTVVCGGRLKFDDNLARFTGLIYRFKCTENILAFSIVSSKQIDFFNPEQLAYFDGAGTLGSGELFSCEGPLGQGFGFGCDTRPPALGMLAGHTLIGELSFPESPCVKPASDRPHLWLTVTTTQNDVNGKPYTTSSQPFQLGGAKCKGHIPEAQQAGNGNGKRHGHRHHRHH